MTNDQDQNAEEQVGDGHCPNVGGCPMFPMFTQQLILNIYKRNYCHARYATCARYTSMMSGTKPPPELLPDGKSLHVTRS